MEFFNSAIEVLKVLVMALGAGLAVWGVVNLLEGYGSDNPGSNAQDVYKRQGRTTGRIPLTGTTKGMWRFGGRHGRPIPTGHWRPSVSPPW